MMFHVRWEETAEDELAALWTDVDSALRRQITETVAQIDRQLETNPVAESESRSEERRILFCLPLGILFRIEADGRTVSILHVWLIQVRNK